MRLLHLFITFLLLGITATTYSQVLGEPGHVTGNIQVLWQQYNEDSLIGATVPPEKTGLNAFGNVIFTKGDFSAGVRYETYLPAINGYPGGFEGSGIGYRFARYKHQNIDVTIGNYYEQFGSGMVLRTYEERQLGIDNALDGFRVTYTPLPGMTLKGIYGQQRLRFNNGLENSSGVVRGFDGEVNINDLFPERFGENKTRVTLGGSFVSKYQPGDVIEKDTLFLQLPENVAAYGGRINVIRGGFTFSGEYVEKINDPSADNGFIYKDGMGLLLEAGYSTKGFGLLLGAKTIDNMSYRSDRNLILLQVPINFIPAITAQHTYNLAATLYPYATVINGESSAMGELYYKFQKDTPLGGKYGTSIKINYAAANSLDTTALTGVEGVVDGYQRNSLFFGSEKFVRDLNIEIKKKISKDLRLTYTFYDLEFNTEVTVVSTDFLGTVYADIHVLEAQYKIKPKNSIRVELQALFTDQDQKDWGTVLAEYTWSPHWFFSVLDQYNFGNDNEDEKIHYLYGTVGYINGSNRISIGYGKRREGIFCVGGVCRAVPASNGFELTITSSF